jgi:hypothetical protein
MIWPIKWWHMGRWNYLTTCHILSLVKKFNQKPHLEVGQKNHPIGTKLLKSTCPRKLKWFLTPCQFGVLFGLKIQFEKLEILVIGILYTNLRII